MSSLPTWAASAAAQLHSIADLPCGTACACLCAAVVPHPAGATSLAIAPACGLAFTRGSTQLPENAAARAATAAYFSSARVAVTLAPEVIIAAADAELSSGVAAWRVPSHARALGAALVGADAEALYAASYAYGAAVGALAAALVGSALRWDRKGGADSAGDSATACKATAATLAAPLAAAVDAALTGEGAAMRHIATSICGGSSASVVELGDGEGVTTFQRRLRFVADRCSVLEGDSEGTTHGFVFLGLNSSSEQAPVVYDTAAALGDWLLLAAEADKSSSDALVPAGAAWLAGFTTHHPLSRVEVEVLLPLVLGFVAKAALQVAAADNCNAATAVSPAAAALSCLLASARRPADTDASHLSSPLVWLTAAGYTAVPRPPRSYVEVVTLPLPQARAAALVRDALAWLGRSRPEAFATVVRTAALHFAPPPPGGSGCVPAAYAPGWASSSASLPSSSHLAWPVAPYIQDFTGKGSDAAAIVSGGGNASSPPSPPPSSASLAAPAWGRYGEDRVIYVSDHFAGGQEAAGPAPRTIHLGVDLGAPAGTPVCAPLGGWVASWGRNLHPGDYGPAVILRHVLRVQIEGEDGQISDEEVEFFTLYGHMSLASIVGTGEAAGTVGAEGGEVRGTGALPPLPPGTPRWAPGTWVAPGTQLGTLGSPAVNGGWPPHLHFQVNAEAGHGGWVGDYPGVATPGGWEGGYRLLCPDPNLLLRCPWVEPVGWDPASSGRVSDADAATGPSFALRSVEVCGP